MKANFCPCPKCDRCCCHDENCINNQPIVDDEITICECTPKEVKQFWKDQQEYQQNFSSQYDENLVMIKEECITNDIMHICGLMGLRYVSEGEYRGVYCTGDSGIQDYSTGLLELHIKVVIGKEDKCSIRFSFLTIDDGGWGAWYVHTVPKEEAIKRVDALAFSFLKMMGRSLKLPSEKDLNDFLMEHEMLGRSEG